jgi:membrane-bound ClpP family serine protease
MAHIDWGINICMTLAQTPPAQPAQGNSQFIVWAVVLLGMAAALFIAELFVPSGGILGACSLLCLIGGVIMLFWIDDTIGLIGAIVSLIAIPFAFLGALWVWPSTPIGRALTLGGSSDPEDSPYDGQEVPSAAKHQATVAIGTVGKTLTALRPVGTCLLDGKRHECLSAAGVIEAGVEVKVVASDGMQIKVRSVK